MEKDVLTRIESSSHHKGRQDCMWLLRTPDIVNINEGIMN